MNEWSIQSISLSTVCEWHRKCTPISMANEWTLPFNAYKSITLFANACHRWPTAVVVSKRLLSKVSEPVMSSWQLMAYTKTFTETTLRLVTDCPKPVIEKPTELLVKVLASSVNPIDIAMCSGYGHSVLSALQMANDYGVDVFSYDRLPLTLGRDFVGVVVDCGHSVGHYRAGDVVWGALPPFARNGSHSQLIVADESHLCLKPKNLTAIEAAAIPYVGLTSWAAIHSTGGLNETNTADKRALVLGGSGGVGTFAIQLLKCWGAHVTTTCAGDAVDFVYANTGADYCIDYNNTNELMACFGCFDFVLNAAASEGQTADDTGAQYLRPNACAKYVTLTAPVLRNADTLGLIVGAGATALTAARETLRAGLEGKAYRWAFYWPDSRALNAIKGMVETNHIKPVVDKRINFNDLPKAYLRLTGGHMRGKAVIDYTK